MPSPFPGMNPYLEQDDVWHDFHERALPAAAEPIGLQVQPEYIVKLENTSTSTNSLPSACRLVGRADLGVTPTRTPAESRWPLACSTPRRVHVASADVEHESFIEIRDRTIAGTGLRGRSCSSPSNKRAGTRPASSTCSARDPDSPAHLVEIDLLRVARRCLRRTVLHCTYSVMVSRAGHRPLAGFWSIGLPDRLPVIPIPLRAGHGDLRLDLQALLHRVYDAAGYQYYIYEGTPSPNLAPEDLAWARQFIPSPPS